MKTKQRPGIAPRVLSYEEISAGSGHGWLESYSPAEDDLEETRTLDECVWLNGYAMAIVKEYGYAEVYEAEDLAQTYNRPGGNRIWTDKPGEGLMRATKWKEDQDDGE